MSPTEILIEKIKKETASPHKTDWLN